MAFSRTHRGRGLLRRNIPRAGSLLWEPGCCERTVLPDNGEGANGNKTSRRRALPAGTIALDGRPRLSRGFIIHAPTAGYRYVFSPGGLAEAADALRWYKLAKGAGETG